MPARRGPKAPGPQPRPAPAPSDDPEVPAWQADYVTCPACRRPVHHERLSRHMELLHPGFAPEPVPSDGPQPSGGPGPAPEPETGGRLRRLLDKIRGRRAG